MKKMTQETDRLQIGEVSKATSVSIDTIRYYEKLGLLEKPERSGGGFRLYPREAVQKLKFIRKAQDFGLRLGEIKDVMKSSEQGLKPCCDLVRNLLTKKITEFESKIKELQKMKRNLGLLLSEWVSPAEARKRAFAVCPQIEREPKRKLKRSSRHCEDPPKAETKQTRGRKIASALRASQ